MEFFGHASNSRNQELTLRKYGRKFRLELNISILANLSNNKVSRTRGAKEMESCRILRCFFERIDRIEWTSKGRLSASKWSWTENSEAEEDKC
jgi:hypothetical protein